VTSQDYTDAGLPPETRAILLLREMTLQEKCHQLVGVFPWSLVATAGICRPRSRRASPGGCSPWHQQEHGDGPVDRLRARGGVGARAPRVASRRQHLSYPGSHPARAQSSIQEPPHDRSPTACPRPRGSNTRTGVRPAHDRPRPHGPVVGREALEDDDVTSQRARHHRLG
jgi:hypothetical protein